MRNHTLRRGGACRLLAITALLATASAHAQNINVTAANASNDAIYSVNFSGGSGTITVLNTDQGSLHNVTSLVFLPNAFANSQSFQLDLLAADNSGGLIVRYPGDFHTGDPTTGTVVFSAGGQGPANPDGLSVDAAGDLFVVNSKSGSTSNPQLWVFLADGAGGFQPPPASPVLIDNNYGSTEILEDTLVAATTVATTVVPPGGGAPVVINPGDLLVLTSSPGAVLLYPGGKGPNNGGLSPITLITLPTGTIPGGLAFWPPDNTLLITSTRGTIYQYNLTMPNSPTMFTQGLGNGQFKIKTGIQSGASFAYVANNNGGNILQFAGPNNLIAVVTSGVQHPQGLAVTNLNYAAVSTCESQTCDVLGGSVLTHNVPLKNLPKPLQGNVLENVCVVPTDPRLAPPNVSCTTDLQVSTVCAGFSDTISVPAFLCGSSGPTGKGFALVKTLVPPQPKNPFPYNGALIFNDSNLPKVLPGAGDPVCNPPGELTPPSPLGTLAWAPLSSAEGIVVETSGGTTPLLEVTSGCDGGTSHQTGFSLFGVGLALNTPDLVGFTSGKYNTLDSTVTDELTKGALAQPVTPSPWSAGAPAPQPPNFTYQLQQCIATSQGAFGQGSNFYAGAALELLTADQNIAAVAAASPPFTPQSGSYLNPSGSLRFRLQNIYYTINTRIQLHLASSSPPSNPPSPPAPTIAGTPALTGKVGTPYLFPPSAHDFAHTFANQQGTTNLWFSIAGKPSWANFDPTTGQLSGTPTVNGKFSGIVITVNDGCSSASLPAFSIKVTG
jgi:sugar lactone lactonase YvrE